jgi:hypothetical protein
MHERIAREIDEARRTDSPQPTQIGSNSYFPPEILRPNISTEIYASDRTPKRSRSKSRPKSLKTGVSLFTLILRPREEDTRKHAEKGGYHDWEGRRLSSTVFDNKDR